MKRKIVTFLFLAMFVLTQFSFASGASALAAGSATVIVDTFTNDRNGGMAGVQTNLTYTWQGVNIQTFPFSRVFLWARIKASPANLYSCITSSNVLGTANGNGSFSDATTPPGTPADLFNLAVPPLFVAQGDEIEFVATIDEDNVGCLGTPDQPGTLAVPSDTTTYDGYFMSGFHANPPSLEKITTFIDDNLFACNTFEMWALYSDQYQNGATWATDAYSGLASWEQHWTTGKFASSSVAAPAAPLGPANDLLSWKYTFPASATGKWSFSINPTDYAGNDVGDYNFRSALAISPAELLNCRSFTDTAGHENEVYIRYLGTLKLIDGNPNGSFAPNATLTRAEASALFEKANGYQDTSLPTSAPSANCTFSDVSASDWFSGWVWQACSDGFMNGLGGGLFGPADLLTRGQIVTIFNNIYSMDIANNSYLDGPTACSTYCTVLNQEWGYQWAVGGYPELRQANWTDLPVDAYYTIPAVYAYGVGIADGTSATTFSPDQPILRGEFAKMLYRALSRVS